MKKLAALYFIVAALSFPAVAQTTIVLDPVLVGLSSPLYVTHAGDGTGRLFIVEQGGIIKVLQPGASTPTNFLDITTRVLTGGERGLLGLAFHPDYETNRRFFVHYTRRPDAVNVIAEYQASTADPNVADTTESLILPIPQPFSNHNGGMIEFGPDGFLYIGKGDGGSANDPGNRAQNINELLGKMLRIDIDTPNGQNLYSSPPSNPFFGATPGLDEIWAVGLRNPFRFSFDRLTGDLYIGDVGQGAREEVDFQPAAAVGGRNYGWRVWEGSLCTGLDPSLCNPNNYVFPITEYGHTGGRCSITGGYVYRGARASLPFGSYIFADFCTGEIFLFNAGVTSLLLDTNRNISSFGEDEAGEVYVVGLGGTVERVRNPNAPTPVAAGQLVISEFRLRGPGGAADEFIEIYNNTSGSLTVNPLDGSGGFAVAASDGLARCIVPTGTVIPLRGHYLCANSKGYSLSSYPAGNTTTATPDATYTLEVPDNVGLALFNTAHPTSFVTANRLDAVGSTSEANILYKEGTGYPALNVIVDDQYSFYRSYCPGNSGNNMGCSSRFAVKPKDTNNNALDLVYVNTYEFGGNGDRGAGIRLGAPGPENLSSPTQPKPSFSAAVIDPGVSESVSPNRLRDETPVTNGTFGTLAIRRTFTNNTGNTVTRFRFRITDITTYPPADINTADIRVLSSQETNVKITGTNPACPGNSCLIRATTLETPAAQPNGGGFNSTLSIDTITLATPIAPGGQFNLHFLLGVEQRGNFRFFINVEVLP